MVTNALLKNTPGQSTSGDRRSKSADWNSAGVTKRTKKLAILVSKSCPTFQTSFSHLGKKFSKLLPRSMEVIKLVIEKLIAMKRLGILQVRPQEVRNPLIRRAGQNNMISSFFAKPVEVPVPMEIEDDPSKGT